MLMLQIQGSLITQHRLRLVAAQQITWGDLLKNADAFVSPFSQ